MDSQQEKAMVPPVAVATTALAMQSSPMALFNRALARSRGMPVPFAFTPGLVACDADAVGKSLWWQKHWRFSDNIIFLTVITPMIFMSIMAKGARGKFK